MVENSMYSRTGRAFRDYKSNVLSVLVFPVL